MPLDLNETITEGEFAGLTVKQLMEHTTAVNAALAEGRQPPAAPAPAAPPPSPAARLDADASERVDHALMFTWQRMEQDDEASFASTVPDYEEYRADIDAAKKNMTPQARVTRGVHARLYEYKKLEKHPELRAQIYGAVQPPTDPPAPPVPPPVPPPPAVPRTPSPVAAPTPGGRGTPPAAPAAKIKVTTKITQLAAAARMTTDDYIKELEERGMTQEDVDRAAAPLLRSSTSGSKAYGRTRAVR